MCATIDINHLSWIRPQ